VERSVIDSQNRDWYSVSVDTLRAWGVLLAVAVLAIVGFFGYRYWEGHDLERRASKAIGESNQLVNRLQGQDVIDEFRSEYQSALDSLGEASTAFGIGNFALALDRGLRSQGILEGLLESAGGRPSGPSAAQFIAVEGGVEFRRSDSSEWMDARSAISLDPGDHVRTSGNGSAEIMFQDGTLYTARPNTQLIVSRTRGGGGLPAEQSIRMEYGWVNLNTHEQGGKVATPQAEAQVGSDSEATVTYDAESRTGRFAAFRGSLEVESAAGEKRRVEALEQVVQRGERLADTEALLPPPNLLEPGDNSQFDLELADQVVLSWEPADGATGYALQIARGQLFVDNVIEDSNRTLTHATLGVRGEGSFLWRVASIGPDGAHGPWSRARSFRVTALAARSEGADTEPPVLDLEEVKAYGSIFIVAGTTEPGAFLEINGEPVQVGADGTFNKPIQITQEGWNSVEVRARDASGNETVEAARVFVEIL